jgi:hypothetical protein
MASSEGSRELLARIRLLLLEALAVVGQLAQRGGGELVASQGQRMTLGRAASLVDVSERTLRRACEGGSLQSERIEAAGEGRLVIVSRSDVLRWAAERASRRGNARRARS